jgi:hypothetical protein
MAEPRSSRLLPRRAPDDYHDFIDRFLVPFDRNVLLRYTNSPERYDVEEDETGGEIGWREPDSDEGRPWFQVRYGTRLLATGETVVVAVAKDLNELPESERPNWEANFLSTPAYAANDPYFLRWHDQNLGAQYQGPGPLRRIHSAVRLVNAVTREATGLRLFRSEEAALVRFPSAENDEAFANAHLELYRYIIDGLDNRTLAALADKLSVELSNSSKTMNSLKELLPEDRIPAIHAPLKLNYKNRQQKHGKARPVAMAAFSAFRSDVEAIATALEDLTSWLESAFGLDAKACLQRQQRMEDWAMTPKPNPPGKLTDLEKAIGKTITRVEFGAAPSNPDAHEREAITLHFSDGSAMHIHVGSNAGNLASEFDGLSAADVHTDLMVMWAPSPEGPPMDL